MGGIANAFGSLFVASHDGASAYKIASLSGYDTACKWESRLFRLSRASIKAVIKKVVVYTNVLASGAKLDTNIKYDSDQSTKALTQIAYSATNNKTKHTIFDSALPVEDFSIELDWSNGSASNPVHVKEIYIEGEYIDDNK